MTTITTYAGKGSQLTTAEVDANFNNLNADKAEAADLAGKAEAGANSDITSLTALTPGGLPSGSITQSTLAANVSGTGPVFIVSAPSQTIPTSTYTKFLYSVNTGGTSYFDTANAKFLAGVAGWYQFNVSVNISGGASSECVIEVLKNGAHYDYIYDCAIASALSFSVPFFMPLLATDYIEIKFYQGSGSNKSCTSTLSGFLARAA
jgi:hypothetical protein